MMLGICYFCAAVAQGISFNLALGLTAALFAPEIRSLALSIGVIGTV